MEILWKVYWVACLLLYSFQNISVKGDDTTTTTSPTTTTASISVNDTTTSLEGTPTAALEEEAEKEDKGSGDLDLETQDQVAILKQINRVNDDGSYTFGYEAADGSFKIETRDINGNVKGMFGFINEAGELKRVSYSASNGTGFQSTGTLNIPPLPGTSLTSNEERDENYNRHKYNQKILSKPSQESSTKISLLESTSVGYESSPEIPSPKLPLYIFRSSTPRVEVTSTPRPIVIQHIPKVRPTPGSSSTEPTESEEILRKPLLYPQYIPKRTSNTNFISFVTNDVTSTTASAPVTEQEDTSNPSVIQVIRPRTGPYKKITVTKRPVASTTPKVVTTTEYQSKDYAEKLKDNKKTEEESGNGVRRQLGITTNYVTSTIPTLMTSGTEDNPDVYGGGLSQRPFPANAYRTLFSQIPQHQRILQNSYIQNQNQYLAAAIGNPGISAATPSQIIPPTLQGSNQGRIYTGAPGVTQGSTPIIPTSTPIIPTTASIIPTQQTTIAPTTVPQVIPQPIHDPQIQKQFGVSPGFVPQFLPPMVPAVPPYQQQTFPNQIYIPPALLENIIRMLLIAQQNQRQQFNNQFPQGPVAGAGNVSPDLLYNRFYQPVPYPNYPQPATPYPMAPMIPPAPYDSQYPLPYYQPFGPINTRYAYQPQSYSPIPYRFQLRFPFETDQVRPQPPDDYLMRNLFGYPRYQPQIPIGPIQTPANVVERSPVYQPGKDSSTSSTTPAPRLGQVRNVQILGQIHDESSTSSNYESSTKSGE